ncbi:MAG: hypothetical protein GX359_11870, partial [Clostridiales bacterium]|nr:hypothetical protein [Clostridiales bacterium]
MKTKKLIATLLVLAMSVMMFAACGKKEDGTKNNADNGGTTNEEASNNDAYPGTPGANEITVNIQSEPPEMFTVTTTD